MALLPFEEASRRLNAAARSYRGIQSIPVHRIVGSVDRSDDFDRDFRARRALSRDRLAQLRTAGAVAPLPAIVVFEVGGAYFVEDGHHRVALAHEQGAEFIDAQVTSVMTDYEIGPDVDVCRLIHTEQQRQLLEETGLSVVRPQARIQFTLLDGYTQLREVIDAYGYRLSAERGTLLAPPEVAADWYDHVYAPAMEAVVAAGLPRLYESWHSTEADQFLWVHQLRRDLRAHDPAIGWTAVARYARSVNLGHQRKRYHLRNAGAPLPRRDP